MARQSPTSEGEAGLDQVGLAGFEPTTPGTQSQCATKLRYSPHTTAERDDASSVVPIGPRPLRPGTPAPRTLYATGWRSRPTRAPALAGVAQW